MSLNKFFNPASIAIIGVSKDSRKIGRVIFENLFASGFQGSIYPVNRNAESIRGIRSYKSVAEIKDVVDLAIIAVPAKFVLEIVSDCVKKDVKACVIISSGFSEIGNKSEEEKIKNIAKGKMKIIGPNVLGIYDAYSKVDTIFNFPYRQERPKRGGISFISQSGAFGAAIMDWSYMEGLGISKFISLGNKMDVDEIDMLEFLVNDNKTDVITIYTEGVKNGRKFYESLRNVTRKKPVVILKAGKSKEGTKAVQSHTGSLAGKSEIYSGMFKQAGVIETDSAEELFDIAKVFSQPLIHGNNIQIITNGGGFGILAADALADHGMKFAQLSVESTEKLKKVLPSFATISNPMDLTGSSTAAMYKDCIRVVLNDTNVDGIVVILLMQVTSLESTVIDNIINMKNNKPVIVCSTGSEFSDIHKKILEGAGIPVYTSPQRAVRAMKALIDYSSYRTYK